MVFAWSLAPELRKRPKVYYPKIVKTQKVGFRGRNSVSTRQILNMLAIEVFCSGKSIQNLWAGTGTSIFSVECKKAILAVRGHMAA